MQSEEFFNRAKIEQEKWINPVGRLILAAASIERSVNEILEFLSPENMATWKVEDFFKRAERVSVFAKENLSDTLIVELKNQKRKYWPVMENRNAIAHNPLFFTAFGLENTMIRATICHQRKDIQYELADVQKFADEADEVAAGLMKFAIDFPKAVNKEMRYAQALLAAMHLQVRE